MKQRPRIYYTESQKKLMWNHWQKGDFLQQIAQPTPAGFFTIIRLGESVPKLNQESERTWKFKNPKLSD